MIGPKVSPVDIPLARRLAAAAAGVVIAATLFRGQLAAGLVTRGDDFLQSGRTARAQLYYLRALRLDPRSETAAERFAFAGLLLRTGNALRSAVAVASEGLVQSPGDLPLLVDRALCFNALHDYRSALRDFRSLAQATGDARYYEFAAQSARRAGERRGAAQLFARVLAIDPSFTAARRELARLRTP